ncbi:MAG: nicotinate phosphoribosyltransferase [Thermoanaerobaculales bacterium]|nr:nicotinate phosphoribosyltransferase [Thermoanaerobaculales bacterium]
MTTDRRMTEGLLFTDFYQLTMAQLYFRLGWAERRVQFDYFFRAHPRYGEHAAGYSVFAGLEWLLDWMERTRATSDDIEYLRSLQGAGGRRHFGEDFLAWLGEHGTMEGLTLRAVPEGRVVHPNVPLVVVDGPMAMAQLIETPVLNLLNYQTLVATKASRIREAACGAPVLEFGMRRAHELGANAGSRAALIGGADFSSNVGVSRLMGAQPKGTHAHSMIQAFLATGGTELDAFRAFAELYPDDCVLLVDTVDTLGSGVPNAIRVFEELRASGHEPAGIRLDSGDLAYLAIQAAIQLDTAGFDDALIVLSNNLDELVIWQIVTQIRGEAPRYGVEPEGLVRRLAHGVGTALVTSTGDSALDGVYKLVAIEDGGELKPAIKLSESNVKTLNPGDKRIWRVYDQRGKATADLIGLAGENPVVGKPLTLCHPTDEPRRRRLGGEEVAEIEGLHEEVFVDGNRMGDPPDLETLRSRRVADLDRLDPGVKRLMNPHLYHVSLSEGLWNHKVDLVRRVRAGAGKAHT